MTVNLLNGGAEPDALRSVIRDVAPDIVACQELGPDSAEVLAELFAHGDHRSGTDYHGGGIFARLPVTMGTVPVTARDGWSALLDPTDWSELAEALRITSVHLTNPIVWPWTQSFRERRGQINDVLTHVAGTTGPLLVAGDFNASPAWPLYRRMAAEMTDGPRAAGTAVRTWGPWWWAPRLLRIDHGWVRGLVVTDSRRVAVRGSDHSGLVMDLTTG